MAILSVLACAALVTANTSAASEKSSPYSRHVATFSVVACDPDTGELGIAVQSKFLAVGAVVPWAKAGIGAVATQAYANTTYGPRGLKMLADGKTPAQVLDRLVEGDKHRERRQVAIVDAQGRVATFTGSACHAWAGHQAGKHFVVQGNILRGEEVVAAMADAMKESEGPLAERLLAALAAGQQAGGDRRGRQSAALLVVRRGGGYGGYNDRLYDLRVDDHARPIEELRRLYELHRRTFAVAKDAPDGE